MDQTAPPAGAQPYVHPEPWPTEQWRSPLIGVALAVLTLPAAASVLVGLLVLAVQGRASWLLVALSALVTTAVGVLASAVAFRRRARRPVRLLAAVAAAWGVATLVAGVVVGLQLESSERVALAVLLVVGGAWTVLFGLLLGLAWWLLPADASETRTDDDATDPDPAGDEAERGPRGAGRRASGGSPADPAADPAAGTATGAAPGRAAGVTSPGPVAADLPPAHHAGTAAGGHGGAADDAALAEWPEWGSRTGAAPAHAAGGGTGTGPVPADVDAPAPTAAPAAAPAPTAPPAPAPAQSSASAPQPPAPEPVRPAGRTASSATPPPSSADDTMVVAGPILEDDDLDVPEPPASAPARRSVSSAPVRGRRGEASTRRSSGRAPDAGPPTQRLPHVDR